MTGIIVVNILLVALVGALLAATPYLMPPTECFAVTVPPSAKRDPRVRALYRNYAAGVGVATLACVAATALVLPRADDLVAGVTVTAAVLVPMAASLALMLRARTRLQALKRSEGWHTTGSRAAALVGGDDIPRPVPLAWELLHLVVIAALAACVLAAYDRLPPQVPMHAGLDGSVTAFAPKSLRTALFPLLEAAFVGVVFAFCHGGLLRSKRPVDPAAPVTSAYAYGRFARLQSLVLLIGGLALNVCMGTAFLLSWAGVVSLEAAGMLVTIVGLGFAAAEIGVSVRLGQSGGRLAAELRTTDGVARDDDDLYKLGLFYVNPDDPSVWVPKRFGVGWTLNYGQPVSWVVTAGLILLIAGFVVGTLLLAG